MEGKRSDGLAVDRGSDPPRVRVRVGERFSGALSKEQTNNIIVVYGARIESRVNIEQTTEFREILGRDTFGNA